MAADGWRQSEAWSEEINRAFYPPTQNEAPRPMPRPEAQMLAGALCTAFDAAQEATRYAKEKGGDLRFSTDDIRSLGISLYIEACKQRAEDRRAA